MVTNTNFDANENPTFVDGCNIDGKRGVYVKGENVIHLDAPEIYFPENAPLPTDKRELYAILNELFQGGSGGGDDWSPPEWWIPVPEPEAYDIYILVWAYKGTYGNTGMNFYLTLRRPSDGYVGQGHIHCDWGDGTTEDYSPDILYSDISHTYAEEGQYLIHITADENTNMWGSSSTNQAVWQIIKTGEQIAFITDYYEQNGYYPYGNLFNNNNYPKFVQINHERGLTSKVKNNLLQSCFTLKKIVIKSKISGDILANDFNYCCGLPNSEFEKILDKDKITSVGYSAFSYCQGLKTINLPNVTTVGEYAFSSCYNLESVYLPNCTAIGTSAFRWCYNLQEIVVAENCTFGSDCFYNCYSLYPRPDGSII